MKRWPIVTAVIAGAITGLLSVIYVGTAINLGTSLTATATVMLFITCPVVYAIWLSWWLVPVLNGMLYGGVAFVVVKWRLVHNRVDKISN
jgi:hypothetical protein